MQSSRKETSPDGPLISFDYIWPHIYLATFLWPRKDFARAEAKMTLKLFIRSLHQAAEMALEDDASTYLAAAAEGEDWLKANQEAEAEEIHEKREELEGSL